MNDRENSLSHPSLTAVTAYAQNSEQHNKLMIKIRNIERSYKSKAGFSPVAEEPWLHRRGRAHARARHRREQCHF